MPRGTPEIKYGNRSLSGSCMHWHSFCKMWRHNCWSGGIDQSGWIPWASKNSSRNRLNGWSCSSENGGSACCSLNARSKIWSNRADKMDWKKFLRRVWKQSSKLWGPLQSPLDGKPAPSWRTKGGDDTSLIGRCCSKLEMSTSWPRSVNSGKMIWANWSASAGGYSAVSLLR